MVLKVAQVGKSPSDRWLARCSENPSLGALGTLPAELLAEVLPPVLAAGGGLNSAFGALAATSRAARTVCFKFAQHVLHERSGSSPQASVLCALRLHDSTSERRRARARIDRASANLADPPAFLLFWDSREGSHTDLCLLKQWRRPKGPHWLESQNPLERQAAEFLLNLVPPNYVAKGLHMLDAWRNGTEVATQKFAKALRLWPQDVAASIAQALVFQWLAPTAVGEQLAKSSRPEQALFVSCLTKSFTPKSPLRQHVATSLHQWAEGASASNDFAAAEHFYALERDVRGNFVLQPGYVAACLRTNHLDEALSALHTTRFAKHYASNMVLFADLCAHSVDLGGASKLDALGRTYVQGSYLRAKSSRLALLRDQALKQVGQRWLTVAITHERYDQALLAYEHLKAHFPRCSIRVLSWPWLQKLHALWGEHRYANATQMYRAALESGYSDMAADCRDTMAWLLKQRTLAR